MAKKYIPIRLRMEELVNEVGLMEVLWALETVCHEKSVEARDIKKDSELASRWLKAGTAILMANDGESGELLV